MTRRCYLTLNQVEIDRSWHIDPGIRAAATILREFGEGLSGSRIFLIDMPGCRTEVPSLTRT